MVAAGAFAFVLLAPGSAAGQGYFPGFKVAAKADVVHVTSNVLARPDDDACAFDADILAAEAESALRRHGFNAVVLQPPAIIDGVTLDVSAPSSCPRHRRLRGRHTHPARSSRR